MFFWRRSQLCIALECCLALQMLCVCHSQRQLHADEENPLYRRILGGSPAERSLNWVTYVTRVGTDAKRCSGNLIHSRWMLTAAHCLLNSAQDDYLTPEGTSITYGCLNVHDATCRTVSATRFIPHPCYTPSTDEDHDDIALIELSEEVSLGDDPFALIDGVNGTVPWQVGSQITLAGFGVTESGASSSTLLQVEVPLAAKETCEAANPTAVNQNHVNYDCMFCTGGQAGKDSCNGDSGGPAVVWSGGSPWLVGILSVGSEQPRGNPGCGVEGRYGVYTFVRKYASFVIAIIEGRQLDGDPCVCASGYTVHRSTPRALLLVPILLLVGNLGKRYDD